MEIKGRLKMKLFNILPLAVTGVLLILSVVFYILFGVFAVLTQVVFILTLAGAALSAVMARKEITEYFKKTASVKGAAKIIQAVIIIAILAFVYLLSDSIPLRIDLTSGGLYSLSEETKLVLKSITNEIQALYFKPPALEGPYFDYQENLLKAYAEKNGNIKIRKIDPYQNRTMAVDYNIKEDAVIVFEYKGNKVYVPFKKILEQDQNTGKIIYKGEMAYTEALKSLLASKPKIVYVLSGHGEMNPGDKGPRGYREIFERVLQENVKLNNLNLIKIPQIPEDCSLLIIGNPVQSFGADELDKIGTYLSEGGSVLVLLEYESHITVNDILRQMGLYCIPNLAVEEADYNPQFGRATIVPQMVSGEITLPLMRNNVPVVMPTATAIQVLPENRRVSKDHYEIQPLLRTSPNGFGEINREEIRSGKVTRDKNDLKGPLNIAYSVKRSGMSVMTTRNGDVTNRTEARMVVFGDSDFVNNVYVDKYGNPDLFLNTVNYLLKREASITIRAKSSQIKGFQLTGSERRFLTIFAFAVCILYFVPGLIIVLNRRKHVKE